MERTLVIGYGNLDRADDGVAYAVVNALRLRLGLRPLGEDETGLEALGQPTDSILLVQLTSDLLDILGDYGQVIFVDAHVRDDVPALHCAPVSDQSAVSVFTHHMTPSLLLALYQAIRQRELEAYIVSIRGHDFDFRRGLSAGTEALVEAATDQILDLVGAADGKGRH